MFWYQGSQSMVGGRHSQRVPIQGISKWIPMGFSHSSKLPDPCMQCSSGSAPFFWEWVVTSSTLIVLFPGMAPRGSLTPEATGSAPTVQCWPGYTSQVPLVTGSVLLGSQLWNALFGWCVWIWAGLVKLPRPNPELVCACHPSSLFSINVGKECKQCHLPDLWYRESSS